jgi:hypothetical protein
MKKLILFSIIFGLFVSQNVRASSAINSIDGYDLILTLLAAYVLLCVSGFFWFRLTWLYITPNDGSSFNLWLYAFSALSFVLVIAGVGTLFFDDRSPYTSIYFLVPEVLIILFTIVCIKSNRKRVWQQDNES